MYAAIDLDEDRASIGKPKAGVEVAAPACGVQADLELWPRKAMAATPSEKFDL